jgi:hypothetical protein
VLPQVRSLLCQVNPMIRWAQPTLTTSRPRSPPVDDEIAREGLRVQATARLEPIVDGGGLEIEFASPGGVVERVRPALVIDCTGPQLDPTRSSTRPYVSRRR